MKNIRVIRKISRDMQQCIQFKIDCFAMNYSIIIFADEISNEIQTKFDKFILLETMLFLNYSYYSEYRENHV